MTESPSSPRELWPADLQWLHALAARLVRDPHAADDAVQDTLVTALERGVETSAPRAWLATVLRNVLRQGWRARARRTARESAASAPQSAPSTLEVVEELSLHRRLAEEVHALDEPYRTAILLRYLRGRSSDEIARDLGVPVKTVRTRLERGLAKLRERMNRDRAAWAVFLAGALPREAATASFPLSLLLPMKAKAIAVLLGVSLIGGYLALRDPAHAPEQARPSEGVLAAVEPREDVNVPRTREAQREPVSGDPPQGGSSATERAAPAPAARSLRGFVRALDGRGLSGIEVVLERKEGTGFVRPADAPRATSGPEGRFELALGEGEGRAGRLNVRDERYACVGPPHIAGAPPLGEPIVLVAPSCDYAGHVLDRQGNAIARARIEITLEGPWVQSRDVGGTAVHLLVPFAEGSSDEQGGFRFEHVGFVEGARVVATAEGFEPGRLELEPGSHEHLELVLAPRGSARTIHGVVLEASGAPAAEALVSLGGAAVSSGPDGTFALEVEDWRREGWLRAARRGMLPAELALEEALRPSSPAHPLVLRLGAAPLAIRGRVLDPSGAPIGEAVVFSPDTTPFGSIELLESGHAIQGGTTVEAFLNGRAGPWESSVHATTRADGSFALEGLLERSYPVFALDSRTLDGVGPLELGAGSEGIEIRLARMPAVPVAGRVVSRSGVPLAGVTLTPGRRFDWRDEVDESSARWASLPPRDASRSVARPAATTDGEGRFQLAELVTAGAFLELRGPALVIGATFDLAGAGDPGALEIAVDAACRFQVVLGSPDEADAFSLERKDGRPVVMFLEVEGLTISASSASIDAGRSGPVLVEEGEYAVVLHSGAEEVRREWRAFPAGGLHPIMP